MTDSKLTYKIQLQYFLDNNEKVVFYNELHSDGIEIQTISVGNNKVIEKTINGRVWRGECLIDGQLCGYEYIYDVNGITTDLRQVNNNISINESVSLINKLKDSEEFSKAKMAGILANNDSSSFISIPSKNFIFYKEINLLDNENRYTYLIQQNFSCLIDRSVLESQEDFYQVNDNYISLTNNIKNNTKIFYGNIDGIEAENIEENNGLQRKVQSIIKQCSPLKELLNSHPKRYKDLKIDQEKKNPSKKL